MRVTIQDALIYLQLPGQDTHLLWDIDYAPCLGESINWDGNNYKVVDVAHEFPIIENETRKHFVTIVCEPKKMEVCG